MDYLNRRFLKLTYAEQLEAQIEDLERRNDKLEESCLEKEERNELLERRLEISHNMLSSFSDEVDKRGLRNAKLSKEKCEMDEILECLSKQKEVLCEFINSLPAHLLVRWIKKINNNR